MIFLSKLFKRAIIFVLSGALFFCGAYFYLNYNFNKTATKIEQKDYETPYNPLPQNCGIVFVFPNSSATLVYLDFEKTSVNLLDVEQYDENRPEYNGYTADYKVEMSYELIEGIINRIGGINIEIDGATMRYTGFQVIELILTDNNHEIKKQAIKEIFNGIAKNNFSKDDFVYIIENSKSNLSIIDCIYWLEHLKQMCQNINYIN